MQLGQRPPIESIGWVAAQIAGVGAKRRRGDAALDEVRHAVQQQRLDVLGILRERLQQLAVD
jgi:hypothetical protein